MRRIRKRLPLLAAILAVILSVSVCACGNAGGGANSPQTPETPVKPENPDPPAPSVTEYAADFTLGFWMGVPNGVYRLKDDGSVDLKHKDGYYTRLYTDEEMSAFYADIVEAGFDIAFPECYNTSSSYNQKILKAAQSAGIRQVIQDGRTTDYLVYADTYDKYKNGTLTMQQVVDTVKGYLQPYLSYTSFYALLLMDEPVADQMERVGWAKSVLEQAAPDVLFYCNLLAVYGVSPNQNDFAVYDAYLKAYTDAVGAHKFLSYDFYALTKSGESNVIRQNWLRNMCAAREAIERVDAAHDSETALWTFTLSTGHGNYRALTSKADASFQAYANMAYGANGIFWFTYWRPDPGAENGYQDGMLTLTGERTPVYDYVKETNLELRKLAAVYSKYQWRGIVAHSVRDASNNIYAIRDKLQNTAHDLKDFTSQRDAICGIFEDAYGKDAYLAVNFVEPSARSSDNAITMKIENHTSAEVYIDGEKTVLPIADGVLTFTLKAGQGAFVIPV